jgi:plastocyanin
MGTLSRLIPGFVLMVVAVACGGDNPLDPGIGPCPANTFCMTATNFNPASRTVSVGTTVNWVNASGTIHNVTFANPAQAGGVGGGASGNIPEHGSGTNSRVFTTVGTHDFNCTLHLGMTGSVLVQ